MERLVDFVRKNEFYYDAFGEIIGFNYANQDYYFGKNLQGDVVELYQDGTLIATYEYDAWGKLLSIKDANGVTIADDINSTHVAVINPIRYREYYYDIDKKMYYLNSRYYYPEIGRFISADTTDVLTATPMNLTDKDLYAYCDNNPVVRVECGGAFWDTIFDDISLGASIVKELLKYLSRGGRKMIILDSIKSDALRCEYIKEFINTSSTYYKENIERKTMFSDGLCYTGYLWDCLLKPSIIPEYKAEQFLQEKRKIFIMWDIHSCERILIPDYWKFPKTKILSTDAWQESFKQNLPEDVYVFDDTFSWSVIFTHETNENEERYCLFIDKGFRNIPDKPVFG